MQPIPCQSERSGIAGQGKTKHGFVYRLSHQGVGRENCDPLCGGKMIIELYFCPARKELDTVLLRCFPQVLQRLGDRNANVFHAEGLCLCLEALLDVVSHF